MAARVRYDLARDLRVRLSAARRRGVDFDAAWQDGWASLPWPRDVRTKADWRKALSATKPEWRSAYLREPSPAGDVLLALAARLQPEPPGSDERVGEPARGGVAARLSPLGCP